MSFIDFVTDQLSEIENITSRRMFGGYGLYRNGLIFAIIADEELYFKSDDISLAQFENLGTKPFTYERDGKKYSMKYWKIPFDILEDKEELEKWCDLSYDVAIRAKK